MGKFDIDDILQDLGVDKNAKALVRPRKIPPRPGAGPEEAAPEAPKARHSIDKAEQVFSPLPAVPSGQRSFDREIIVEHDPSVPVRPRDVPRPAVGDALSSVYQPDGGEMQKSQELGEFLVALEAITTQALGAAQTVVCALPLTPATQGLLNAQRSTQMPQGAYLINIARGGHVVEADLIAAVRCGHLSGAALDVQQHETLPADDPLWSVEGITITPHTAAQSSLQTIAAQFVAGYRCLQRGEALPKLIDQDRGY